MTILVLGGAGYIGSHAVDQLVQKYPETVLSAGEKYEPSVIAKHAIKLAQAFNPLSPAFRTGLISAAAGEQ